MQILTIHPVPDLERVAEETSAREVNRLLRDGWVLLLVVAVHDDAGGYPSYVIGRPRVAAESPLP